MKIFLDTNVVIDFYDHREQFFQPAAIIFDLAFRRRLTLCVSTTTFVNAFYLLRKAYPREELYSLMSQLSDLCEIAPVDAKNVRQSLSLQSRDFEDCVQYHAAIQCGADALVTRNTKDFADFSSRVITPTEFLDQYYNTLIE